MNTETRQTSSLVPTIGTSEVLCRLGYLRTYCLPLRWYC
nr:MAG TPA: hypothetical protein [Caudoviricetes sp.]DAX55383.1 MAG TPA: hypothetical protein [Caudoviricetes sp.]